MPGFRPIRLKVQSENNIEQSFLKKVKKRYPRDLIAVKMNIWGLSSWPDRLIVGRNKLILWIEFKRPGQNLTDGQQDVFTLLRGWGFDPQMFDDAERAFDYVVTQYEMGAAQVPKAGRSVRR